MQVLVEAALLAIVGIFVGFGVNVLSPRPVALSRPVFATAEAGVGTCEDPALASAPITRIDVSEATTACEACSAAFVDARSAREFEAGHVIGALHLPPIGHADEGPALRALADYPVIIVYDGDTTCRFAEGVARRLLAYGLNDVRVLEGAWPAWVNAGGPGASGVCAECAHAEHRDPAP